MTLFALTLGTTCVNFYLSACYDWSYSWGTAQVPSALSVRSLTEEENESVATICDEDIDGEEMKSTTTPRNHPTPPLTLQVLLYNFIVCIILHDHVQASKMHYVENKVLSHERGKSEEKLMVLYPSGINTSHVTSALYRLQSIMEWEIMG